MLSSMQSHNLSGRLPLTGVSISGLQLNSDIVGPIGLGSFNLGELTWQGKLVAYALVLVWVWGCSLDIIGQGLLCFTTLLLRPGEDYRCLNRVTRSRMRIWPSSCLRFSKTLLFERNASNVRCETTTCSIGFSRLHVSFQCMRRIRNQRQLLKTGGYSRVATSPDWPEEDGDPGNLDSLNGPVRPSHHKPPRRPRK